MPARLTAGLAAVVLALMPPTAAAQFRAQFDRAILEFGKQKFPRLRVETPWHWHREFRHRGLRYRIYRVDDNSVVQTTDDATRKVLGRVSASAAADLRWVGANEDVGFVVPYRSDYRTGSVFLQLRVLRLDLKTMRWMAPLDLTLQPPADSNIVRDRQAAAVRKWREKIRKDGVNEGDEEPTRESVLGDVLITEQGLFALTCVVMRNEKSFEKLLGCEISYFPHGSDKPSWRKWFDAADGPPQAAVLVASTHWDERPVQPLTRLPNAVLLCIPHSDELLCLDDAGRELWRLPRIWEYARGFGSALGYSLHIDRFAVLSEEAIKAELAREAEPAEEAGLETARESREKRQQKIDAQVRAAPALRAERSARFYQDYDAWIMAGPVRVDSADRAPNEARLFVAVGRMPKQDPPTDVYTIVDCIIYEVTTTGQVAGLLTLPLPVDPQLHFAVPSGLIWGTNPISSGEHCHLLRMSSAHSADLICPMKWYREYDLHPNRSAPFVVDRNELVVCANQSHLFRSGGSYDLKDREHVHRFNINVVDLESGMDMNLTLSLPYEGKLPTPIAYRKKPNQVQVLSAAYPVGIERLHVERDTLHVVLTAEESAGELEFDVSGLRKLTNAGED